MSGRYRLPIALTIAGSDSGGGAGIQADLKTFAVLGTHGTCVVTCLTAQNPSGVIGVEAASVSIVKHQLAAVFTGLRPNAVKTGMLYSDRIIRVVAEWFRERGRLPLVVDPVMLATSGARLLKRDAMEELTSRLIPLATVVTPNMDEAQVLAGNELRTVDDLKQAAVEIYRRFGCAVLVKGGHLRTSPEAVDVLFDGNRLVQLAAPRIRAVTTHGTGCTYSAAITAGLAQGMPLVQAVKRAKEYVTAAIARSQRVGRHSVLNLLPFPTGKPHQTTVQRRARRAAGGSGRRTA